MDMCGYSVNISNAQALLQFLMVMMVKKNSIISIHIIFKISTE